MLRNLTCLRTVNKALPIKLRRLLRDLLIANMVLDIGTRDRVVERFVFRDTKFNANSGSGSKSNDHANGHVNNNRESKRLGVNSWETYVYLEHGFFNIVLWPWMPLEVLHFATYLYGLYFIATGQVLMATVISSE